MLEKIYWIAGVVVAVVAIVGLFLRAKTKNATESRQSANVSGQNNTVNQRSDTSIDESRNN